MCLENRYQYFWANGIFHHYTSEKLSPLIPFIQAFLLALEWYSLVNIISIMINLSRKYLPILGYKAFLRQEF